MATDEDFETTWSGSVQPFVEPPREVLDVPTSVRAPETPELAPPRTWEPSRYEKQRAYRLRTRAAGKCQRCGKPLNRYASECNECRATNRDRRAADQRRRTGHQAWRPGHRGMPPRWFRHVKPFAEGWRDIICDADHDECLVRTATIMAVGFFFQQRLDIVAAWLGYPLEECETVATHLRASGIWTDDGYINCVWLEAMQRKRLTKQQAAEWDLAFWLDAMVGAGILTREGDTHLYGLVEWK